MGVLAYFCRGCANLAGSGRPAKWKGPCPTCGGRWSIVTKTVSEEDCPDGQYIEPEEGEVVALASIADEKERPRMEIGGGFSAVDRLIGGGIVPGTITLLSGSPGIGKSTLTLQVLNELARGKQPILYASGEESIRQIRTRAKRLGTLHPRLYAVEKRDIGDLFDYIDAMRAKFVVIDSVQTLTVDEELLPGSPTSITLALDLVRKYAQRERVAFWVIGHVTSDGTIAGPHSGLVHAVDAVLYFSLRPDDLRRLAAPEKNRYGETGHKAYVDFAMTETGLVAR